MKFYYLLFLLTFAACLNIDDDIVTPPSPPDGDCYGLVTELPDTTYRFLGAFGQWSIMNPGWRSMPGG